VTLREFLLENFAGDMEYHPRRSMLYLALAAAAFCCWLFSPSEAKFTATPLVFALGSLALLVKGIFLLRKYSDGIGLSQQELKKLSETGPRKALPPVAFHAAQIIQDFGTGGFLFWPLLNLGKDIDNSWNNPPHVPVFVIGAVLFSLGWLIRRLTSPPSA
jgi:hypothetical protein